MKKLLAIASAICCASASVSAQTTPTLPKQPYVIDSAGKNIGPFSSGSVYVTLSANQGAFVLVNQAGFLANSPLYYLTANCSGAAFLKANDVFPTYGSVLNRTLYYPLPSATRTINARSFTYIDFNGCVPTNASLQAVAASSSPIVQNYPPPFTIQPR